MAVTHQGWTDELVAQIEDWDTDNGKDPVIEFHLDEGHKVTELVFADVSFKDGIIVCKMEVF